MRHTFRYRIKDSALIEDHVVQSVLFRELVHRRPTWLTCATYEIGPRDRVLLLDVADIEWIEGVLELAYDLDGLGDRCEGAPDHDVLRDAGREPSASYLVGCWDPAHEQWCIPCRGSRPAAVGRLTASRVAMST